MAIRIDENTIKEYADRNGLPEVYESFKSVKTQDDYNKWKKDPVNRRVIDSIELESRKEKRASLVEDIKKKDPTLAPFTSEEIFSILPDEFAKIENEKAEYAGSIPDDLFVKKDGMSNKEWLAVMRQRFKDHGLDFDNPEDRRNAAKAQSERKGRENLAEESKAEYGETGATWDVPRSAAKLQAGKPVETLDAVADAMRIAEAAPMGVGVPAIVGRNILEGYLDDKTVPEATKETVADIGSYVLGSAAGLGLGKGAGRLMSLVREPARKMLGGVSAGQKGLAQLMEGGKGTRAQVVKATRDALEGKKAPVVSSNPYRKDAEKLVNDIDMTATQKNKAKRILEDYLDKGDIEKVSSKAETATVSKKIGKNFDKEVEAEAKRIGKQATTETMTKKLDFDDISKNLTDEERNDLLLRLRSSGLRTDEGAPAFVGVSEITTENPNAARAAAESEVIAKWLDENKTARNKVFRSEAAEKVLKGYGKQADTKTRKLLKFVTEEPVLYESFKKEPVKAVVKSVQNVAPKSASRRFSPVLYEHYDFEDREGKK
jgi:hypothetical protein